MYYACHGLYGSEKEKKTREVEIRRSMKYFAEIFPKLFPHEYLNIGNKLVDISVSLHK